MVNILNFTKNMINMFNVLNYFSNVNNYRLKWIIGNGLR
jgi:hypothetical protein